MSLPIRRGGVYLANLEPGFGAEPGKTRPVLVLQTDLLNTTHPSTIVLPLTTQVQRSASHLRVHVRRGDAGLEKESDILIDQIRAIDNRRLVRALGELSPHGMEAVIRNVATILDLDGGIEY